MRSSFDNLHRAFRKIAYLSGCKAFAEMYVLFYWFVFIHNTDSLLKTFLDYLYIAGYCFYRVSKYRNIYIKFSYIISYIFLAFLSFGLPPHSIWNCYEVFEILLFIPLAFSAVLLWSKEPILCCIADLIILITLALMLFPVITNFKFDILVQNIIGLSQEFGIL